VKIAILLLILSAGCYPNVRPELIKYAENAPAIGEELGALPEALPGAPPYEFQGPKQNFVAQIKDCQNDISVHNILTWAMAGLTTGTTILGVSAAWSNNGHNSGLTDALFDAGAGFFLTGVATLIPYVIQAKDYADDGCSPLTGTLPYSVRRASRGSAR